MDEGCLAECLGGSAPDDRDEERKMEHELDEKYEQLRESYQQEQQQLLSLEEARKNKPKIWEN